MSDVTAAAAAAPRSSAGERVRRARWWWWPAALLSVASVASVAWLVTTTPAAFPFGDVALIEIVTGTALRQPVMLGPYSQFGWNHPGPAMFYALAPFYLVAGSKSIGLAVGAVVLNLTVLAVIGWTLARHAGAAAAVTVSAVLSLYVFRTGDLVTSVWNPHLIVLPLAAVLVLCAASVHTGGAVTILAVTFATFAAQSSVSVVPFVAAVAGAALVLATASHAALSAHARRVRRRGLVVVALVGLTLWVPPLFEQLTTRPGNLAKLFHFFVSSNHEGQTWRDALLVWADATTAVVRPDLALPWGEGGARRGTWVVVVCAVAQLALLVPVAGWAQRTGRLMLASLSLLTAVGSLAAVWSITRIAGSIGQYQIFWMSTVGALNVALVASVAGIRLTHDAARRRHAVVALMTAVLVVTTTASVAGGLWRARAYALIQRDQPSPRREAADATVAYLTRERVRRPLFHLNATSWLQATAVVLHAYRRHGTVAVDQPWVSMFGTALAADGSEDVELHIGGGCPADRRIVARADGLCVYEAPRP